MPTPNQLVNPCRLSSFAGLVILVALICLAATAQAQLTRTWVSGVGDDSNLGDRTTPCKTLAGAYSKTAAGGEINALDPGGFGALTITKGITINGRGKMASILSSAGSAITVNTAGNVVTIRNLYIDGVGTGTYGIRIVSAGVVRIENCVIFGGTTNAIDFQPTSANARLYVVDSHIYNFSGAGIYVNPAAGGTATIVHSVIERCGTGITALAGTTTVTDSTISGNTGAGLAPSGGGAILTYHNNEIFGNNPDGNPTGWLLAR